jgi:hypothetical protein
MHNRVVHDPNNAHFPNGEANRETHRCEAVIQIQNACIILTWLGKLVIEQNNGTTSECALQNVIIMGYLFVSH